MAGITLAQAETRLTQYLDAEAKILLGQKVEIDGQLLQRADLATVREGVTFWDERVKTLSAAASGRARHRRVMPTW